MVWTIDYGKGQAIKIKEFARIVTMILMQCIKQVFSIQCTKY